MVDAAKYWRRYGTAAVSLLSGALVLWLALHSNGSDWYISHANADVLFTGVRRFHEYPFFSFVFGGGAYFLQDPQSSVFSLTSPLVLLAGPTIGLRLMEGVWGALGCYAFIVWMRRHVSETAAQFGALAWCTSLGVFWRVTVGNDMFLWHLGLPILLWLLENLVAERTWRSSVALGLALGVFLLGPTFHTFMYLFVPVLPIFGVFLLLLKRPKLAELGVIAALLLGALALGVLIASPKFACWTKFPMGRPTQDPGGPSITDTLLSLVDYTQAAWREVRMGPPLKRGRYYYWGVEESAVALPPPATLLIPVGVVAGLLIRRHRPYALLALTLVGAGFAITTSGFIWDHFRELTHGNFRVAPRYLAVSWFGLAILATLGAEALFTRWSAAHAPLAGLFFAGVVVSALVWTHAAGQVQNRRPNDTVSPEVMNPFAVAAAEYKSAFGIESFRELIAFNEFQPVRAILEGVGLANGFLVVGNEWVARRWYNRQPIPIVLGLPDADVKIQHTKIRLRSVPPEVKVHLRLVEPRFGLIVQTTPPNAPLSIEWNPSGVVLTNHGQSTLESVVLRPKLPISAAWFFLSAAGLLGACGALTFRRWARYPAALRRLTFSV